MKRTLAMAVVAAVLTITVSLWAYLSGSRTLHARAGELTTAIKAANVGNELSGSGRNKPDPAPVVEHAQAWAKKITLATAATGLGLTALVLLTTGLWQRSSGSGGVSSASPTHRSARVETPAAKSAAKNTAPLTAKTGGWAAPSPTASSTGPISSSGSHASEQLRFELAAQTKIRRELETQLNELKTQLDKKVEERLAANSGNYARLEAELNQRKQAEKNLAQQRQELERSKDVLELHVQARTQELQKLQRRYEHILNSAGEGIYGLDMQGKTTFLNPAAAKLTGYTVEELSGKLESQTLLRGDVAAGVPPASPPGVSPGPAPASGEQTFYRKDGTTILVEYTRTPIIEHNKQIGAVVTFKDITERKRAEETLARKAAELARSNGELEQFAYVASHDLQEPLRKIRAFGDRLKTTIDQLTTVQNSALSTPNSALESGNTQHRRRKKNTDTTQQEQTENSARAEAPSVPSVSSCSTSEGLPPAVTSARDYLERMQNAAARMQTLINDLLTFSRVVSTTQPFIPVDLTAVTREVLGDLEVRIQQTGAKIQVGDLPTIHADPTQMRQLIQNIIANALKFQPSGRAQAPEIFITAQLIKKPFANAADPTADDQICELAIKDNGIGFDPKYTEKIFAMFQRLHGRAEYEGTGVGLAVCRRITDRHSGTITATSQLGHGATFIIRLPVNQTNKVENPDGTSQPFPETIRASATPEGAQLT
jgi:PAS domain S-box-containing protein